MRSFITFIAFFPLLGFCQIDTEKIFTEAEVSTKAQHKGGEMGLAQYLIEELHFPRAARKKKIQGKVETTFVVDKTGKILDIEIVASPDESLSEEARRVLKEMASWKPAELNGLKVSQQVNQTIAFCLTMDCHKQN